MDLVEGVTDFMRRAPQECPRMVLLKPVFGHANETTTADGSLTLISSYHPSRQNTQTGRLTREMFRRPFARARELVAG